MEALFEKMLVINTVFLRVLDHKTPVEDQSLFGIIVFQEFPPVAQVGNHL